MKRLLTLMVFVVGFVLLFSIGAFAAEPADAVFYDGETSIATAPVSPAGEVLLPAGPAAREERQFVGWALTVGETEQLYPAGETMTLPTDTEAPQFHAVFLQIKTLTGAAVTYNAPITLRFDGAISIADYDRLSQMEGITSLQYGMLIAPYYQNSRKLIGNNPQFTADAALSGLLVRSCDTFLYSNEILHVFGAETDEISNDELLEKYAARAYITVTFEGSKSITLYAPYVAAKHIRTAFGVSACAFEDRVEGADAMHTVACGNYYSPYTAAQLSALQSRLDKVISVQDNTSNAILNEYTLDNINFFTYRFYVSPWRVDRVLLDTPADYNTYVIVGSDGYDFGNICAIIHGHSYTPGGGVGIQNEDGLYIRFSHIFG